MQGFGLTLTFADGAFKLNSIVDCFDLEGTEEIEVHTDIQITYVV